MEELVFNFDESEVPKKKEVITYEPVEKGIRQKPKRKRSFTKMRVFVWLMWRMNFWN